MTGSILGRGTAGAGEEKSKRKTKRVSRAVARVEEVYLRLSKLAELAPAGTLGRAEEIGYGELLSLLSRAELGERDVVRSDEPEVP